MTQNSVALQDCLDLGRYDEAAALLKQLVTPHLDYTSAQFLVRSHKQLRGKVKLRHTIKLALLGGFTTKQLASLLDLYLFAAGVNIETYESDFGVFRQDILNPQSELYSFHPQIIILATTWRDLTHRPKFEDSPTSVHRLLETELSTWANLWQTAHELAKCHIIHDNYSPPPWRPFDNLELRHPSSLGSYIAKVNQLLAEKAYQHVTIHDVDTLAALQGRWRWHDPRFFHQAKLPCDPECLIPYAASLASIITTQFGLAKKCLVLDLDNTLWGGVIGDDGIGGIRLGQGTPEGEAFVEFQHYLKSLRNRGVLLAICSKNQEAVALEVFEKHPEMLLRLSDISCFVANWNDKASNLRFIAKALNIGLDSLVFVDDNPAERAIARQLVPEVAVPELPDDVTGYIKTIEQHHYFQTLSVGTEDLRRTEYYQAESQRQASQVTSGNLDSFLASLSMRAKFETITSTNVERCAQLIQRSNQFNLTTRRRSATELSLLLMDSGWVSVATSLSDRFGDNGLICVLLARHNGDVLDIDTWLMSCRVLKRGVEQALLNHLVSLARERGVKTLRGTYISTPKNELVRRHYEDLGFSKVSNDAEDNSTRWELNITSAWRELSHHISQHNGLPS